MNVLMEFALNIVCRKWTIKIIKDYANWHIDNIYIIWYNDIKESKQKIKLGKWGIRPMVHCFSVRIALVAIVTREFIKKLKKGDILCLLLEKIVQ